jgi:UDP-3-O-[3-hydroxymyristoyl] glucosamine N-acyltransferase
VIEVDTAIYSRAVLKNSIIGNNCLVQSGSIIGEDGFAFERKEKDMKLEIFPHYGKVIIKDDVEIFANCFVARGSLSDTIIEQGPKIEELCQVAHNVQIGKNTQFAAGVAVGGSTTIGDNCWVGLNSIIKHRLNTGNNVIVGSDSSVIHYVEAKDIVAGVPAKSIRYKISISEDKLFLMAAQQRNSKSKM